MKTQSLHIARLLLFALILTAAPLLTGNTLAAAETTHETQPVYTTPDGFLLGAPVPNASAKLSRGSNGLTTTVQTYVGVAGVYSVWWVVFNHPGTCQTYLCTFDEPDLVVNTTAHVVSLPGAANLSGSLHAGAGPYSGQVLYEGPEPQLANPAGALITLVIRYHGPKLAGSIPDQLTNYLGGCADGGAPCQDIQLAVFPGAECSGNCSNPSALP
jgi:hypothetical protein